MKQPVKIFVSPAIRPKHGWLPETRDYVGVEFVDVPGKADIKLLVEKWSDTSRTVISSDNNVYWMRYISGSGRAGNLYKRADTRSGIGVDDKIPGIPEVSNFCFTGNDFLKNPYLINVPVGFNTPERVSQPDQYWMSSEKYQDIRYTGRLYWKGNTDNHMMRREVINYYRDKDPNFSVNSFEYNVYVDPCPEEVYTNYVSELKASDMSFCLRGDRPSTHSFFDLLQYGCIPVNINCMEVGWENILENVSDYMLNYDMISSSLDDIHTDIVNVMKDRERVLRMKRNCVELFETLFKDQPMYAWGEFILAKCIEIYKNNYDVTKISNKLISEEYLTMKGLTSKL